MGEDASDQATDFFVKRADYNAKLAATHIKSMEYEKGMKLYQEAYGFLQKAIKSRPDDEILKKKMEEIKLKYTEAKKKMQETPQKQTQVQEKDPNKPTKK